MSETKFTPGPWRSSGKALIVPATGEGHCFSNGDWDIIPPAGERGPVAVVDSEANANLIGAVTDLYETLYAIMDLVAADPISGELPQEFHAAAAALAKARGES